AKRHPTPCKLLHFRLKHGFTHWHSFPSGKRSPQDLNAEEMLPSDMDEEDAETNRIVFAVRRLALEARHRHKDSSLCEGLKWVISPVTGELTIAPVEEEAKPLLAYLHSKFGFNISLQVKENQEREGHEEEEEEEEEEEVWFSVRSDLSCCSSPVERKEIFLDCAWRSLLEKLSFCEGWPFGLYRRKMMLPPLPRCPSEPWMWRKATSNTC
ncbi:uncharacterized protein LOC110007545, partial [Amborella trichopoda]